MRKLNSFDSLKTKQELIVPLQGTILLLGRLDLIEYINQAIHFKICRFLYPTVFCIITTWKHGKLRTLKLIQGPQNCAVLSTKIGEVEETENLFNSNNNNNKPHRQQHYLKILDYIYVSGSFFCPSILCLPFFLLSSSFFSERNAGVSR